MEGEKKKRPKGLDVICAHCPNLSLLPIGPLLLLTNDIIISFLLTDDHAFLITGHVLTGRTLGTRGSSGQQGRPPTGRQGTSFSRSRKGAWSPKLCRRFWARVGCRARHHLQGGCKEEFSWGCYLGQPSLPVSLTPMACTPDLSQFLQCLAVYFSSIQAVDPTVGEGSGPGRTRSNCVQTFCPTRAAPWSLGVRAQECLGCDRQKLRGHCRVEGGEKCCRVKKPLTSTWAIFLSTGQKQDGTPGPPSGKQMPFTSLASPSHWLLPSGAQRAALLRVRKPGDRFVWH